MLSRDWSFSLRMTGGPRHPRDLWEIDGDGKKGKSSVRGGITQHHSGRSRRHLLWILSICYTHTNTETYTLAIVYAHPWTHIHKTYCVHTHSYTWMHTNSSTIDGKQNHMFLHNHIHGQNHILHRPNTFQGPWSCCWDESLEAIQSWWAHLLPECWGVTPWKIPLRISLVVQWLRLCTEGGTGSTPGWGTKIQHATWWGRKIKRKIKNCSAITEFHSFLGPTFQDPSVSHIPHRWIHIPSICIFRSWGLSGALGNDLARLNWMKLPNTIYTAPWVCWSCVSMEAKWMVCLRLCETSE